jgi:TonB family protein
MSRGLVALGLVGPDPAEPPPDDGQPGPISPPLTSQRRGPGGIAISTILHGLIIALLIDVTIVRAPPAPKPPSAVGPSKNAVFLPPPATVRRMLGLPPAPPPRPAPTPPPPSAKDRVSIGPPATVRQSGPLELHRDIDLTAAAKGTPNPAAPAPPPVPAATPPPQFVRDAGAAQGEGGRLAPSPVRPGVVSAPGPIHAALQRLENGRVSDPGPLGIPTGNGVQMGPLFFDPQGADFTLWTQRFTNEVYRNWIVPPAATLGWGGGEVTFDFVVDRSGAVVGLSLVESSGIPAYDRAARNALVASRLMALPSDFGPDTLTIRVGFTYGTRAGGRGGR